MIHQFLIFMTYFYNSEECWFYNVDLIFCNANIEKKSTIREAGLNVQEHEGLKRIETKVREEREERERREIVYKN